MAKPLFSKKKLAEIFYYLDDLRESGVTNMYGSGAYVMDEFNLERVAASKAVAMWMKSFSHDKSPDERATEALAKGDA